MKYLRPGFMIIGEQKCGTSSLYRYLVAHPDVLPCKTKEPQLFHQEEAVIEEKLGAYWALFPEVAGTEPIAFIWPELDEQGQIYHETVEVTRIPGKTYLTGEASANTFREVPPRRLQKHLPEIKLILMLRNPIERAFSLHRMYQRFQAEGRELDFGVRDFEADMKAELHAWGAGISGRYLATGMYARHLNEWWEVFGKERLFILITEELADPLLAPEVMNQLQIFLELPHIDYTDILAHHYNQAPTAEVPESIRAELTQFFTPYNESLAQLLERELPWT